MKGQECEICLAAFSEYLNLIATLTRNGYLYLWDFCNFTEMGVCADKISDAMSLCFAIPFRILLSLHESGNVIIWEVLAPPNCLFVHFKAACRISPEIQFHPTSIACSSILYSDVQAQIFLGTEEGDITKIEFGQHDLKPYGDFKPLPDCRKKENYNANRIINGDLPSMNTGGGSEFEAFDINKIKKFEGINPNEFKVQSHKEPIYMIKLLNVSESNLIISKGDSQSIKMWAVNSTQFELQGCFNVDAVVPYTWAINPENKSSRLAKLAKALACLHQLDMKVGTKRFANFVEGEYFSQTFKTEVTEPEKKQQNKYKQPILYHNILEKSRTKKRNVENIYESLSFRQIDIRKSKLEIKEDKVTPNKIIPLCLTRKVEDLNKPKENNTNAFPEKPQETKEEQIKELNEPILNSDISKFKLLEKIAEPDNKKEEGESLLPNLTTVNSGGLSQKKLKRQVSSWIDYAKEKDSEGTLPLLGNGKEGQITKNIAKERTQLRKQLLGRLIERKKKSMVSRYSSVLQSYSQTIGNDTLGNFKVFSKETFSLLKLKPESTSPQFSSPQ